MKLQSLELVDNGTRERKDSILYLHWLADIRQEGLNKLLGKVNRFSVYVPAPGLHASAQEDESYHTVKETPPEANGTLPVGETHPGTTSASESRHWPLLKAKDSGFQQLVALPPALINVLKILFIAELLASHFLNTYCISIYTRRTVFVVVVVKKT